MPYFSDAALGRWVRDLGRRRALAGVFAFSSPMADHAASVSLAPCGRRVVDFCDVDSDKWRQYAAMHGWPLSWVYKRESRLLEGLERHHAQTFDATLVVTEAEAELLRDIAPEARDRIRVVGNGVDTVYFDPVAAGSNPFPPESRPLVFTGAMDYFANVDAVTWFAHEVFPAVRAQVAQAEFAIVGSNPSPDVRVLGRRPGVMVTGTVPDIRPYLAHAALVVAPLRIARGVQNKVLEALAMARPVVATQNAVQGISGVSLAGIDIAADAAEMTAAICRRLATGAGSRSEARAFVVDRYGWNTQLRVLDELFPAAGAFVGMRENRTIGSVA
jgi:sugar transferase (PEP-CTERM/EpsH1 system associated)